MNGRNRNGVGRCKFGHRRQLVTGLEPAVFDLVAERRSNDLVRPASWPRSGYHLRHDAAHCCGCTLASLVDPTSVDLQRRGTAASMPEPAGDSADVYAGPINSVAE